MSLLPNSNSTLKNRSSKDNFSFQLVSPVSRLEQLLFSEYMSDVTFRVFGELIHAHKLILTLASEVFFSQFNGGFVESYQNSRERPIDITDIEPGTFREVLRYIYCEKVKLTAGNIVDVYYAAKKYMLEGLISVCKNYLNTSINHENVLQIFNNQQRYGRYGLFRVHNACLRIIQDNPLKCFESKHFLKLSELALQSIAACETMNCRRSHLCSAIAEWCFANNSNTDITPKLTMSLQCRKLRSFAAFRYARDVSTRLKISVMKNLHLYGLGVFVGTKYAARPGSYVTITVTIYPWNVAFTRDVYLERDLFVEEFMFEKLTVTNKCWITVDVRPSRDRSDTTFFCLDGFKPVDSLSSSGLTITCDYYATFAEPAPNCVSYLLYNVD